jgi:hypothetical protein
MAVIHRLEGTFVAGPHQTHELFVAHEAQGTTGAPERPSV